ncbi:hypothetical protein IGI04_023296 [Brassica rapa subsp. trilocularis]|uniref:Uncharacterized protein n=1 Tax=Brassica rapa subsp. trilocularis TaxID=1813537 RepID=A0ABQ7M3F1_BRACM|nr:hypothetical protein IGI04_023296 [Brassica rapa subsp. trilocularis]
MFSLFLALSSLSLFLVRLSPFRVGGRRSELVVKSQCSPVCYGDVSDLTHLRLRLSISGSRTLSGFDVIGGCDLDEEDSLDEEAEESMDKSVMSLYNDYLSDDDDYFQDGVQSFQVGFLSGGEGESAMLLTFSLAGSAEFSGVSCFSSRFDSPVAMALADVVAISDGIHDRPRSTDQYMEPNQPGDQNVLNISTEVHVFHPTGQTDRAVYWTVPHTSGKELWLEPWPDDRSDHTGACLSRPTSHLKTYGRARIHFGRAGRGDTYLGELDELSELSDTTLELDELSELNETSLELNELSNTEDGAGSAAGRNGTLLSFLVRLSRSFDPSFVGPDQTLESVRFYLLTFVLRFFRFMMFGLQRKSNKEKPQRNSNSQTPFKYPLNYFDEFVSVQEQPAIRRKTTRDVADPKRQPFQIDVQQICDNLVKGVDKALKDFSKSQKKSTSICAPVAEPSLFISKKAQGESENHFEELKDFSDSLPIFDESDEELIESLMFCEKDCDLPSLETEFINDNEQANVELTVLQPEHPSPIFDEEDEPGPVFDEEATSITSIAIENYLCFDPGTTPAPLPPDLQEHCEEPSSLNSLPDMFVKVSTDDVICFGLDKMKEFFVSKSVFDNMINSLNIFEPDKCFDQSRFQNVNGITSGIILSFDQFLEHNKGFHLLGRTFDLDLQQTEFCAEKSLDSFVCKGNGFDLSSSRHVLITDELFASSYALDGILIQKLLEQKSLETENDFRDLEFCGSVLQPDLLSFETDKTWHFLRSFRDNGVVLSSDDILVYNTFFEKCLGLLINDSQTELKLVCSDVGKDIPILKMNTVVAYLDKILVCNIYFDEHLERLKNVQFVLGKDILICDLNKYLSCTFDAGLLVFILSIQERQVHPLRIESIGRAQQPQIWRSFVVQTCYLGASNRGSVQEEYLNSPKVFCLDSNVNQKPTHQRFTEASNRMKSFMYEEVMNFPNRISQSMISIRYEILKACLFVRI